MREQTVANHHHHHHLCEATREEMGGKKRDEGEEDKKISIRRELRDVCWLSRVLSKIKDRKA
jgi:hypothetical protein